MNFVHLINDESITIISTSTGEQVKYFKDDERYPRAITFVKEGNYDAAFNLDTLTVINTFFEYEENDLDGDVTVAIKNGKGIVTLHDFDDMEVPLHSAIVRRVLKMKEQGFSSEPIVNFIAKLYRNPSSTAVKELFLFIDACDLPITEDGDFIAYKVVRNNYLDCHSGTILNRVGDAPAMPRYLVDDNRNNTCSQGLHFCSRSYLVHFATLGNRCMLVKINPANVVSIPSDYNNAKGRTWSYDVVGEIEGDWLAALPNKDFTEKAVVSDEDIPTPEEDLDEEDADVVSDDFIKGYIEGFADGKAKVDRMYDDVDPDGDDAEYASGYVAGYKDGRNKKKRLYK